MKKQIIGLLLCLVFVLQVVVFAACGPTETPDDGDNNKDTPVAPITDIEYDDFGNPIFEKKITLNVWSVIGNPDNAYLNMVNQQFNEMFKSNNVQANITSIDTSLFYTQFANALNTDPDNAPDVVIFHSERLTNLADNNMIIPIESCLSAINMTLDKDNYLSNVLAECYAGDTLYGIPLDVHSGLWYVRDDILTENGLTRPTTLAEFEAVCQALKDKQAAGELWIRSLDASNEENRAWRKVGMETDFFPVEMSGSDNMESGWLPQTAVLQNGGTLSKENGEPAWGNDTGLKAILEKFQSWQSTFIGANRDYNTLWANLGSGNAVFGFEGSWWAEERLNQYDSILGKGSIGVMGLSKLLALDPDADCASKVYGVGHCFAVSKSVTDDKVKAAGALYAKFMTENSIKYMKGGHLPACKSVLNNPEYTSSTEYDRYLKYMGDPANFVTLGNTKYFSPVYEGLKMAYIYTFSKNVQGTVDDFIKRAYDSSMSQIRAEEDL